MRKKDILLSAKIAASALVAGVILTATAGNAWAYFTTNTSASGGYAIELSNETEIVENFSASTKRLVVTNSGTQPVYVRATAFSAQDLSYSDAENKWVSGGDGYYYYSEPVVDKTSELLIKIVFPENKKDGDGFNVVVIYESAPVQYDANGNALKPWEVDWSAKLDDGSTEGGVE